MAVPFRSELYPVTLQLHALSACGGAGGYANGYPVLVDARLPEQRMRELLQWLRDSAYISAVGAALPLLGAQTRPHREGV